MLDSKPLSAHRFPLVYQDLELGLDSLGCVMLNVEPFSVIRASRGALNPLDLYRSSNPKRFWIDGEVSSKKAHLTLLYGLLPQIKPFHVAEVLNGWEKPRELFTQVVDVFPSPYRDEDSAYACVVAKIRLTKDIMEGHSRLSFLPHVNTFPEYNPHVTLAYVREEVANDWAYSLNKHMLDRLTFTVTGLDLGEMAKRVAPSARRAATVATAKPSVPSPRALAPEDGKEA